MASDTGRVREEIVALAGIRRASASDGERRSARWIVDRLDEAGLGARVETERAVGDYWLLFASLNAAGALGGVAALRGRRALGATLAAAAAAGIADDLEIKHRLVRRLLARRRTFNVVTEVGPRDAPRTVVFSAHHDAARSGLVFKSDGAEALARRAPWLIERINTEPPIWYLVLGGPAAAALGAALGRRGLTGFGAALSGLAVLGLADIGARPPVPGANDNASGVVAQLELARRLAADPPANVRVMLVWPGAEESLWEGMHGFARRHFPSLPPDSTFFLNVDQVGYPCLNVVRGEGPVTMDDYPDAALDLVDDVAEELGIELFPDLRSRSGSDGRYPLKAGYPCAFLGSVTEDKLQPVYHWPTDAPDAVTYESIGDAARLCEGVVRRLEKTWLD
jgi:Peptidase family M28